MILTLLALIIAVVLGYQAGAFFIGKQVRKVELLPIAIIVGLAITAYAVLLLALIFKDLKTALDVFLILGISSSTLIILKHFRGRGRLTPWPANFSLKKMPWLQVIFILAIVALYLDLALKTLVDENGSYKVAAAGFGDIPFHMTEISYFINNKPFALEETIYAGARLNYPFMVNLLSASFYLLNGNYIVSFHLPSLLLAVSGLVLAYLLISRIIKKASVRICAFLIFFLGSSLGFLKIIKDSFWKTAHSWGEISNYFLHLPYAIVTFYDAVYPNQNIIWATVPTMFLLHQRSFFFGLALGILVLFVLVLAQQSRERRIFYFAGLLVGLLPLIHMHTFIAAGLVIIGFFAAGLIKRDGLLIKGSLRSGLTGLALAALPILSSVSSLNKGLSSFLVLRLGWMAEPNGIGAVKYNPEWNFHFQEWLSFIWQNFGLFFPILLIAVAYFLFKKVLGPKEKGLFIALLMSALILWLAVNLVKFQPWDYDSNKILAYFFLIGALTIGLLFDRFNSKLARFALFAATLFMIATGAIDVLSRSSFAKPALHEIFGSKDRQIAEWIKNNIPPKARLLTSAHYLNLASSLAGKPVLMGYGGWLWTRGIDYGEREHDINAMFQGGETAKKLFKKYNVDYILIGLREREGHKPNETFFETNYPQVFQLDNTKIYKIQ